MVYRALTTLTLLILISGCASVHKQTTDLPKPMLMADVYAQSVGDAQRDVTAFINQNLKERKTFGYVHPYLPVVEEPVVRKVWIPDHKSEEDYGVLIGGHWVYLMIQGPQWFIENEASAKNIPIIVPRGPKLQDNKYDAAK